MSYSGCLILIFATYAFQGTKAFQEKGLSCMVEDYTEDDYRLVTVNVESLSLCDNARDCVNNEDETPEMCESDIHRLEEVLVSEVGNTSASLNWEFDHYGSYMPDGFLLTRRSDVDAASTKLENAHLQSYIVKDLLPFTTYTIILRPYRNNRYGGKYKVGRAKSVSLHTSGKVPPASTAPRGLEDVSIHCQDPIVPSTNITVASLSLCDEVQDCFQGADEMKELCGNIMQIKLLPEESAAKSVTLNWSMVSQNKPWAASIEAQRTTLYGKRTVPDGFFVTTISKIGVLTPDIENIAGTRFRIGNLNSSTNYTFLVRPYVNSAGSRRGYKVGKLVPVSVTTEIAGLQNITSFRAGNEGTLVTWNAEADAQFFRVNFEDRHDHPRELNMRTIRSFPNSTAVGTRSKLFSMLLPPGIQWSYFTGAACGVHRCSNKTWMKIQHHKKGGPVVTITYVAATSPTSFDLRWTMEDYSSKSIDGFWVTYCKGPATSCRVLQSSNGSLTVIGLTPATTYNIKVQPRIRTRSGNIELGVSSEAQISTWTNVPEHPTLNNYHVVTPPCQLHVSWTFYNSTVSYIQVSLENDIWLNCTTPAHCNAHVFDDEMKSDTATGSLIVWNLEYYTSYEILLRGCNKNGCGSNASIGVSTPIEASSAPVNLSVEQLINGTELVRWERPLEPRGPLDGYAVSWKCEDETTMEAMVADVQFLISESLTGQNCSASVLAFHITAERHQLRGKQAYIEFELTDTSGNPDP
ncbi:uncharacterized protein LOC135385292 [Ornithodoros turicata]|uniref:uncharacterized protein LOC135385292 n=1 Tax=Ornithodoros turicata TaxID=34597 RepID=UPI0031398F92